MLTKQELSGYIDHTLLKPDATKEDVEKLCKEAILHKFRGVCVNPFYIGLVSHLLKGKKIKPIAAIGFPLGASQSAAKAFETKESVAQGAEEIDMVINVGALKEKRYDEVYRDIQAVVGEAGSSKVKVIIETFFLTRDEKIIACALAKVANAFCVKTSTGFFKEGAKVEDIALMKTVVKNEMQIKASGKIKSYEEAVQMLETGANILGTSHSIDIIKGAL